MNGILVIGEKDNLIDGRAKSARLSVEYATEPSVPFAKTLIVASGTSVPFGLLNAAWHFLDRWDAAVPFWRYGMTADKLGTAEERAQTKAVIRDLRVLTHAVELVFVRNNDAGNALISTWNAEQGDRRLAFLRAMYTVKPMVCVLPTAWLHDVEFHNKQDMMRRRPIQRTTELVKVEIEPGRFVKVHKGDEQKVIDAHLERKKHERIKR